MQPDRNLRRRGSTSTGLHDCLCSDEHVNLSGNCSASSISIISGSFPKNSLSGSIRTSNIPQKSYPSESQCPESGHNPIPDNLATKPSKQNGSFSSNLFLFTLLNFLSGTKSPIKFCRIPRNFKFLIFSLILIQLIVLEVESVGAVESEKGEHLAVGKSGTSDFVSKKERDTPNNNNNDENNNKSTITTLAPQQQQKLHQNQLASSLNSSSSLPLPIPKQESDNLNKKEELVENHHHHHQTVVEKEKEEKPIGEKEKNSSPPNKNPLPPTSEKEKRAEPVNNNNNNSSKVEEDDDNRVIPALTLEEFKQKQAEEALRRKGNSSQESDSNSTRVVVEKESDSIVVSDSDQHSSTTTKTTTQQPSSSSLLLKKGENEKVEEKEESEDNSIDCSLLLQQLNQTTTTAGNSSFTDDDPLVTKNCSAAKNSSFHSLTEKNDTQQQQMLVIEKKAIDLIPLETMLSSVLGALASIFMIFGGAIPYVPQYAEIHRRKSALGFSLLVCLALCVANILRIMFWFGKRFETVLLIQSVVMITTMILMLEISVRMNRKMTPPSQRTSIWKGHLFSAFWKWNDLTSFIVTLLAFTAVAGVITYFFTQYSPFVEALGMISLLTEACLALPQLIQNFQRKSTQGMSINMVLMWLMGDVGKTIYFVVRKTPAQFWICGSLQITIDILILLQVYFYNRKGNSRIPTYIPSQPPKNSI